MFGFLYIVSFKINAQTKPVTSRNQAINKMAREKQMRTHTSESWKISIFIVQGFISGIISMMIFFFFSPG